MGAIAAAAVLVAGAIVVALWRGPDAPAVHLPAYERYDSPTATGAGSSWFARAHDLGPPAPLAVGAAVLVAVALTFCAVTAIRLRRPRRRRRSRRARREFARRTGRWWVGALAAMLLVAVTALVAHQYTAAVVSRDTHVDDGHTALAVGTGPVLEVRTDGLRSVHTPPRHVALTFDDGPDPRWSPAILRILAREHVAATFFVIGEQVVEHPDLVRRMVAQGSEVGVHTYRHLEISLEDPAAFRRDLRLTQLAIVGATGHGTALFRPPFITDRANVGFGQYVALSRASATGYVTALADRDSTDWSRPGVDVIVRRAMPRFGAGAIIEMHDGGGNRSETVAALGPLIERLKRHGYQFDTVGEIARLPVRRLMPRAPLAERVWASVFVAGMRVAGIVSLLFGALVVLAALLSISKVAAVLLLARRSRRSGATAPITLAAMPSVSVLVAACNEAAALPGTLRALCELRAADLEIIVVDDGSCDGTADVVREWSDERVRLVCQPHAGKAAALQAGLRRCFGEIVVTVDADTRPDRDALCRIVEQFRDPHVAAVSGNLRVADATGWLGRAQQLEYVIANAFDRRALDELRTQVTVPGAIGAYRRTALLEVGNFAAGTVAEDTDLTLALVGAGHRIRFVPEARARTDAPRSVGALWRQRSRWSFGILQAVWRRRSIGLAWRSDPRAAATWTFALVAQVLLPLTSPLLDVAAVWALLTGTTWPLVLWALVAAAQFGAAAYALRCEGEPMRALWAFPLHLFGYRQLTAFVVPQALAWAAAGRIPEWGASLRPSAPIVAEPVPVPTSTPGGPIVDLTVPEVPEPAATPVGV